MPRRRETAVMPSADEPAPSWLLRFECAVWLDETERPPSWVNSADPQDVGLWRQRRAWRRWSDAGKAWAVEHGWTRRQLTGYRKPTWIELGLADPPPDNKINRRKSS